MSNTNRKKAKKIAEDVLIPLIAERDAALARNAELEADIQNIAGGALVEEAETSVRRIHAEVERDMARQALTSADAMNRHWDEINAHRDLLVAERDALRAELDNLRGRLNALGTKWEDLAHAPIDKGPGFSVRPHYAYFADELHTAIEGSQHGRD